MLRMMFTFLIISGMISSRIFLSIFFRFLATEQLDVNMVQLLAETAVFVEQGKAGCQFGIKRQTGGMKKEVRKRYLPKPVGLLAYLHALRRLATMRICGYRSIPSD